MANSQKTTKTSNAHIPLMTANERVEGARGFVMVTNANPLPAGATAYRLMINEDAVITKYVERKNEGGGSNDKLAERQLAGVTLKTLLYLTPPRHRPIIELEVGSGSIVAYLEDADF